MPAEFASGVCPKMQGALAQQEPGTPVWFALKFGKAEFGIFDAFPDDTARSAHLSGPIAAALMKNADVLLAQPPKIERVDLLASKVKA